MKRSLLTTFLLLWAVGHCHAQNSILYDFDGTNPSNPTTTINGITSCSSCNYDIDPGLNYSSGGLASSGQFLPLDLNQTVALANSSGCSCISDAFDDSELYMGCWFRMDPQTRVGNILNWRGRANLAFEETKFTASVILSSGSSMKIGWALNGTDRASREHYLDGDWHHIALSFEDGDTMRFYLDFCEVGQEEATNAGPLAESPASNQPELRFGSISGPRVYMGGIDEIDIRDRAFVPIAPGGINPGCLSCYYGDIDPMEFPPGYPGNVTETAAEQMELFPVPRYPMSHDLKAHFPFLDLDQFSPGNLSNSNDIPERIENTVRIQEQLASHFNYAILLGDAKLFTDDNLDPSINPNVERFSFEYNWIELAKRSDMKDKPRAVKSLYAQLSPKRAANGGKFNNDFPEIAPLSNEYIGRLDLGWPYYATDTTTGEINQPYRVNQSQDPNLGNNLYQYDYQTLEWYLTNLSNALGPNEKIQYWGENGEGKPKNLQPGSDHIENDQWMRNEYGSTPNYNLVNAERFLDFYSYYRDYQYNSSLVGNMMSGSKFSYFNIGGYDNSNSFDRYTEIRDVLNAPDGERYPTVYYYPQGQIRWRLSSGSNFGLSRTIESRREELDPSINDRFFAPFVSPGWDDSSYHLADRWMMRPAPYLGMLKVLGVMGAEYFHVFQSNLSHSRNPFFDCDATGNAEENAPEWNVWQLTAPGYAQATLARKDFFYKNSDLMDGDLHTSYGISNFGVEYGFNTGDQLHYVSGRQGNLAGVNDDQFLISGTIQTMSTALKGSSNERIEDVQIQLTSQIDPTVEIRSQGSTYFLDNSYTELDPASRTIFYQLDGWHEYAHPGHWTNDFYLEAELFEDNPLNALQTHQFEMYTDHTTVGGAYDFSDFTTYLSIYETGVERWCNSDDSPFATYTITPRSSTQEDLDLFVRARLKNTGLSSTIRVDIYPEGLEYLKQTVFLNNISSSTQWEWLRLNANGGVFKDLEAMPYVVKLYGHDSNVQIDALVLTPAGNVPTYIPVYTAGVQTSPQLSFINVQDPTCNEGNDGSAEVVVTGGTGPYSYLWDSGTKTAQNTTLFGGTHTVFVTDNGACLVGTVNLAPPTPIAFDLEETLASCHNVLDGELEVINITGGTGPYSMLWNTGDTGAILSNLKKGDYEVKVSDANNCVAKTATFLGIDRIHELVLVDDVIHNSSAGLGAVELKVNGCSGANCNWGNVTTNNFLGNPSFAISPSVGQQAYSTGPKRWAFSGLTPDTYTFSATYNGCTVEKDFEIASLTDLSVLPEKDNGCASTGSGSITVNVMAGTPPYIHKLYNQIDGTAVSTMNTSSRTTTFGNLVTGNYYVESFDNLSNVTNPVRSTYLITNKTNCKSGGGAESVQASEKDPFSVVCFPNPASERVYLRFEMPTDAGYVVEIRDIHGHILHRSTGSVYKKGQFVEEDIDLKGVSEGLYFFTVRTNTEERSGTFTVQR